MTKSKSAGNVISREALIDLRIIEKNFPCTPNRTMAKLMSMTKGDCKCRVREKTLVLPEGCPYSLVPENRQLIEKWILDYYGG